MRIGAESPTTTRRAEEIRKRRTERSQKRVTKASTRATSPLPSRPVTVRGNAFGTPIHRQASKHAPRRAFYVTVNQAVGTELRLPALPVVRPGWRLVSGLILILTIFGIYSLWGSPFFQVDTVSVTGLQRITPDDVINTLRLENLSIVEINSAEIAQKLNQAFPDMIGVRVSVSLPNQVAVQAAERQPVAIWEKGGETQWLDADGVVFPARGDAGVPLITIQSEGDLPFTAAALTPAEQATQDALDSDPAASENPKKSAVIPVTAQRKVDLTFLAAAQSLAQKLPAGTPVVYSSENGLGWNDPEGWQVFVGTDLDNFAEKYAMYQKIVSQLAQDGQKPALVSVQHLNAPFYRLEP
jgi:cell division protein FtsQ